MTYVFLVLMVKPKLSPALETRITHGCNPKYHRYPELRPSCRHVIGEPVLWIFLGSQTFPLSAISRVSTDSIKRIGQVNKCYEKVLILLLPFLLQLAGSEDHVNGPTATPEKPHWLYGSQPMSRWTIRRLSSTRANNFPVMVSTESPL